MKKTITRTLLATMVLLLSYTVSSYAQTYYHLYLCDNATATLHPEEPVTPLVSGDKVHWFLDGVALPGNPKVYDGTAASIDIVVPASLTDGLHVYTTAETLAGCLGDPSDPFNVYKLPTKTLALTENRATYCAADSNPSLAGAIITATTTPTAALPAGIDYAYTWTVTSGGNPATPGTPDNSNTATSVYTMNTTTAGSYVFNASVKYVLAAGNTGVLVSADTNGCSVTSASSLTVIVTPKPTKPTISLVN